MIFFKRMFGRKKVENVYEPIAVDAMKFLEEYLITQNDDFFSLDKSCLY